MKQAQTALITGVSRGIGKALALEFMSHGIRVAGVSRSRPDYELDLWIEADVTDAGDRGRVVKEVAEAFEGRLDILINNAGRGIQETWEEMDEQDMRAVFELNVFSMVSLTRAFLPMLKTSAGTVINVSSVAGRMPVACMGAYCATKYAVNAFSGSLRIEMKPYNVRVLNLIVGRISTGFSDHVLGERRAPSTPGSGAVDGLARAAYKAWRKGKREIIYPSWYRYIFLVPRIMPGLYARMNIRKWGLDEHTGA